MRYKKNDNGFTMVEMIIVLVILAIVTAIAIPVALNIIDSSDDADKALDAKHIWTAIQTVCNEQLANGEHYEADTHKRGMIINKFAKGIDGKEYDLWNGRDALKLYGGTSDSDGEIFYVGKLMFAKKILDRIENGDKIEDIYFATAKYYDCYQRDDYDNAYKVYLVMFRYKDEDEFVYYDGKSILDKWPLDKPSAKSLTEKGFILNGQKLQFYAIKLSSSDGNAWNIMKKYVKQ